jgi:hypothetical protein
MPNQERRSTMKYAKRMLMVAGAVALAGIVGVAIAPKAAHGLAAAMVQVVNTAASPVIAQDTARQAAQIVTLSSVVDANSFSRVFLFNQLSPQGGTIGPAYVTPSGQNLVITSIEFAPTAGSGDLRLVLLNGFSINTYEEWSIPAGSVTDLQYPSGLVIGSGASPIIVPQSGSTTAAFNVYLHGYLTAN